MCHSVAEYEKLYGPKPEKNQNKKHSCPRFNCRKCNWTGTNRYNHLTGPLPPKGRGRALPEEEAKLLIGNKQQIQFNIESNHDLYSNIQ